MLSLVFGFIQSSTYGWLHVKSPFVVLGHTVNLGGYSATPLFIIAGLIILSLFIYWESIRERSGKMPLISLSLFKNSTFMTGSGVSMFLALGQSGLSFSVPVYLQSVLSLNPIQTGFAMVPMTALILVSAPLSGFLAKYISPKLIIQIGIIIDLMGFVILRQSLHLGASQWALAPGFAFFGFGVGLIFGQASNLTLSAVSVQQSGEASGVNSTLRSLGQTLGSAILGAVLISSLGSNLVKGIESSAEIPDNQKPIIANAVSTQASNVEFGSGVNLGSVQIPVPIAAEITTISHQATIDASQTTLSYGILFIFLTLLISIKLPSGPIIEPEKIKARQQTEPTS
jgi:hypothetical protein